MLASTFFDLVVGVDLHFELVPPVMAPVPFPHPFVGLVFDPMGLVAGLVISNAIGMATGGSFQGPVLINLMPATTTGTEAQNKLVLPHFIIPPGTVWAPMVRVPKPAIIPGKAPELELPIPPPGDAMMITGSKTVHAMGANLCRLGDLALSCSDPIRLPTSVVVTIPKGLPVLVGGPPAVDWLAAAFAMIKCKWIAERLHRLVNRIKNARLRDLLHKGICFLTGHPVDVATGRVLTDAKDFELPGPLPLVFERNYASSFSGRDSVVGHGWSHSLDQAVWIEPGCVVYRAEDGREIEFDTFDFPHHAMRAGDEVFEPINRLTLRSLGGFRWTIETAEGVVHTFEHAPGDHERGPSRLVSKRSRNGHEISLHYDERGRLAWVRDCGGRIVRFNHDERGKLLQVSLPHPTQPGWMPHTRYVYSPEGDLVEVIDPLGHVTRHEYAGHLLVRETDRTGFSFHFGYDGNGPGAYCIRTWGDGGIYDHEIDYDKRNRVTFVTDSLGETTRYEMNVAYAVTKVIDALGGVTRYEYDDDLRKVAEIDPLGNTKRFAYDARGNRTKVTMPDGAEVEIEYDAHNQPIVARNACGATWRWRYDEHGQALEEETPLGEVTRYEHRDGMLSTIREPSGAWLSFTYDAAKNRQSSSVGDGIRQTYEWDAQGRLVRKYDARGNPHVYRYDACSRLFAVEEPDGNVRRFSHDAEGRLLVAQDHRRRIAFRYDGLRRPVLREDGESKIAFSYDTEGRLVEIRNEAGHVYQMTRDECGRVIEERDFDGQVRRYVRDLGGRTTEIRHPSGRRTRMTYDPSGRLIAAAHSDGTSQRYVYRADGALCEAKSDDVTVRLERDLLGRVVREWQNDAWVESRYAEGGRRNHVRSSIGATMSIARSRVGDVDALCVEAGGAPWQVEFTRDPLGFETRRVFPGHVQVEQRFNGLGQLEERSVVRESTRLLPSTTYRWGLDHRIEQMSDDGIDAMVFGRDERMRLAWAQRGGGRIDYRMPDAMGNLFRTPDRSDRSHTRSGAPKTIGSSMRSYDADGHLIAKVDANGGRWTYAWNGAGRLTEVIRPDGVKISYTYDAFGRRVSKRVGGDERHWLWDGRAPIHESSGTSSITWVFEPDTFRPLGRLEGQHRTGLVTDHLGAPVAAVDDRGEVVWKARLDIYGAATVDVAHTSCPFRWPGQYVDDETGLHYNGFRYYDPETGTYISQDPIRLLGGFSLYGYPDDPTAAFDALGLEQCWSNKRVKNAAKDIENGLTSVRVAVREEAEELFLGLFQGQGYRNTTGMSAMEVKELFGKAWTYHWDDAVDETGRLLGHALGNPDSQFRHLQIHTEDSIIRIFFGNPLW